MTQYKMVENDCLSLLATCYNTTKEELKKLNTEQIKEVDFIFSGASTKTLPEELEPLADVVAAEVIDLIPAPKDLDNNSTCESAPVDYVDILYIPAHPVTGKREWFALTEAASKGVKEEQKLMANAIVKEDYQASLQRLQNLRLLSKFQTKSFEQFIKSKEDKIKYRAAILLQTSLSLGLITDAELPNKASAFDFDYEAELSRESNKLPFPSSFLMFYVHLYRVSQYDSEAAADHQRKVAINVKTTFSRHLKDIISDLEDGAKDNAKQYLCDDGTRFSYSKEGFFTSEKQLDIQKSIKNFIQNRPTQDDKMIKLSLTASDEEYQKTWATITMQKEKFRGGGSIYDWNSRVALRQLNSYGYVAKEQLLPPDILIGGKENEPENVPDDWQELSTFTDKQLKALCAPHSVLIQQLRKGYKISDLPRDTSITINWAYYPTLSMLAIINRTMEKNLSGLKSLIGVTNIPGHFEPMLLLKRLALERLKQLKEIANTNLGKKNILYLSADALPVPNYTLLWDEDKWKPAQKTLGHFINQAGLSDIQAVEGFLLSDEGKVCYLRGPTWYMPTNKEYHALAKGHVKCITGNVKMPNIQGADITNITETITKGSLKSIIEALKENKQKLVNFDTIFSKFDGALWKDSYHWQGGMTPDGNSAYIANASAQFMRFTMSASGSVSGAEVDANELTLNKSFAAGTKIACKLTLLSGQLSFQTWLPMQGNPEDGKGATPAKGVSLELPYDKVDSKGKASIEYHPVGQIALKVGIKVYGMAAASLGLGAAIEFGQSDTNGIGVRGSAHVPADYNQFNQFASGGAADKTIYTPMGNTPVIDKTAQAGVSADVFVGVECGGSLSGELLWNPPPKLKGGTKQLSTSTAFIPLGSISTNVSLNVGVGAQAYMRFAYDQGCIVFITAARWVCGPGVSGKIAISINPDNTDSFVGALLGVLEQSGFQRIRIFGDVTEDETNFFFELLNNRLTTAIALGLTLADIALFPASVLKNYLRDSLEEEFAPLIAKAITRKNKENPTIALSTQQWVYNLPPETLAPLLKTLINAQTLSFTESADDQFNRLEKLIEDTTGIDISGDDTEYISYSELARQNNQHQLNAVMQILHWISTGSNIEDQAKHCHQFEQTLYRMGVNLGETLGYEEQWLRFVYNWLQLAVFVKQHKYFMLDDRIKTIDNFNLLVASLSRNIKVYRCQKITPSSRHSRPLFFVYYQGPGMNQKMEDVVKKVKRQIEDYDAKLWPLQIS